MDIDVRPPPPATLRSFLHGSMSSAAKRARSPESSSHLDRPAKRLIIATHGSAMDSAEFSDSSFGMLQSAPSSRFPSEDWVCQARRLSIDNTRPYESRSTNSSFENLGSQSGDVDMMDSEEQTQVPHYPLGNNAAPPEPRYYSGIPHRLLPHFFTKMPQPEINVTPATPTSGAPSLSSSTQDLHEFRHSSLPLEGSPIPMSLTPPLPQTLPSPASMRRPRFSMGPRADCEKCRLGVKGHWAHFD